MPFDISKINISNDKRIRLLGNDFRKLLVKYIFNIKDLRFDIKFKNKNNLDLRKSNIEIIEHYKSESKLLYNISQLKRFKCIYHLNRIGYNKWSYYVYEVCDTALIRFYNDYLGIEVHSLVDRLTWNLIEHNKLSIKYDQHVKNFYVIYKGKKLHRYILKPKDHMQVDHIDLNTLNNLKSNLREVTNRDNVLNQGIRADNSSGYKGVTCEFDTNDKVIKFKSEIRVNGKSIKKSFSVNKYGYKEAFRLACEERERMNNKFKYRSSTKHNR